MVHGQRQQRISAQVVVIVQVFVPQRQPLHALRDQALQGWSGAKPLGTRAF
jgi:hypothetical protein